MIWIGYGGRKDVANAGQVARPLRLLSQRLLGIDPADPTRGQ
jgi:hypothetical protein